MPSNPCQKISFLHFNAATKNSFESLGRNSSDNSLNQISPEQRKRYADRSKEVKRIIAGMRSNQMDSMEGSSIKDIREIIKASTLPLKKETDILDQNLKKYVPLTKYQSEQEPTVKADLPSNSDDELLNKYLQHYSI